MEFNITQGQFGVRPPVTKPSPAFLELVGEEGLRQMVSDHYDSIKESDIRMLFPMNDEDFEAAKVHSADFIIQICGGPAYFNQHRGAPQMVGRHAPFRITPEARMVWIRLYSEVLKNLKTSNGEPVPEATLITMWNYLDIFSLWMVNTPS